MPQWRRSVENKYVFNNCLKAFCDKSGDCNSGDCLFQVVSPLSAKLCCKVAALWSGNVEPAEFWIIVEGRCCRRAMAVAGMPKSLR